MISYAQNHEDVILDRAFQARTGFYVDVGAASPTVASVTRHFYELGWSGINIEPLPEYADQLRVERPRDQIIEAAAGAASGQRIFHVVEVDHDLSTMDPHRVEKLAAEGQPTKQLVVNMVTLDEVLETAQPTQIDFLKIDAEGAERDVLLGIDLFKWRPRVLVIEATAPNSQIPNYRGWEELVVSRGYQFASSDGINRYYVRNEDSCLIDRLGPANVLDEFVPAWLQLMTDELERLRTYIAHVESEVGLKDEELERLRTYIAHVESEVGLKDEELERLRTYIAHAKRSSRSIKSLFHKGE